MSIQSYNEEVKKRVGWVKKSATQEEFEYNVNQLIGYLSGLDWFAEEEKLSHTMPYGSSETLGLDNLGSTTDWKFCPIHGVPLRESRGKLGCQECI